MLVGLLTLPWVLISQDSGTFLPIEVTRNAGNTCILKAGEGVGSGVVLGYKDGYVYVLTSLHQVKGESRYEISWFEGFPTGEWEVKEKQGSLKGGITDSSFCNPEADLAIVRFFSKEMSFHKLRVPKKEAYQKPGLRVFSVGLEKSGLLIQETQLLGRKLLETSESSENKKKIGNQFSFHWETKDITVPGRSGGPLLNSKGEWIGVCHGYQDGKGYYTHFWEVLALLKKCGINDLVSHD